MKIRTYSTAWGEHLELLNKYVLPSIQPSIDRLRAEGHSLEHQIYKTARNYERRDFSDGLCENFIDCMKKCIENDEALFLLQPDTVWGSESFYNICHYGEGQEAYIALPHLRFRKENFNATLPMRNQDLLDYCWNIPHQTTANANIDIQPNLCNTRQALTGIANYTISNHYYPTIYYFKPNQADVACWEGRDRNRGWIFYDTGFQSFAASTERIRVIGSSDIAFCAELEDTNRHHSALENQGRNMPTVVQGRKYAPKYYSTGYVMRADIARLGK